MIGDTSKAKQYYYKAIATNSSPPDTHKKIVSYAEENLAVILTDEESPGIAKEFIQTALLNYPNSVKLWTSLAVCEYKLGKQKEALAAIEKAKTLLNDEQDEEIDYLYRQISNNQPIKLN